MADLGRWAKKMHPILANAAIPVVMVAYPRLFWLLPAVVAFEVIVARRSLSVPLKRSVIALSIANVVSAIIGAAVLAGICWMFYGISGKRGVFEDLGFAFWLYSGRTNFWLTLTAMLIYFAFCYVISVFIEHWIVRYFLREFPAALLKRYSWRVHIPSYLVLVLLWTALNIYWIAGEKN